MLALGITAGNSYGSVKSISAYHPPNVNPSLVGSAGLVIAAPSAAIMSSTFDPPSVSKEIL